MLRPKDKTVDEMLLTMKARSFSWPFSMHGWIDMEVNEGPDVCSYDAPIEPCPAFEGEEVMFKATFTVPYHKLAPEEVAIYTSNNAQNLSSCTLHIFYNYVILLICCSECLLLLFDYARIYTVCVA